MLGGKSKPRIAVLQQGRTSAAMALEDLKAMRTVVMEKTLHLRALRLAKEAADQTAVASRRLTTAASKKLGKAGFSRTGSRSNHGRGK